MPSDAASLPETLDGTTAPTAARTRQDNLPTTTIDGNFSEAHRKLLEKIDAIQATVDFIKITSGTFSGKQYSANGRACVSFTKFLINFRSVVFRSVASCPTQTDAVTNVEAIFRELRPGEEAPEFITFFNQLVFDILLNACDEEALNIVLRYEHSDDETHLTKKDGRRALFALMQTYAPVSTNAGNLAKQKLECFRFKQDKDTIQSEITEFHIMIQNLEAARAHKLEPLEHWSFVTSAIKGSTWTAFRLTISMQPEYKARRSFWFIDQVREYILALEDDHDTSSPPSNNDGRKKSILNAAKASDENSTTAELAATVSKLAATVAAITTNKETSSRVKGRPVDERSWHEKMGPCRFCGGSHRHRDCHTLKTGQPKPPIPPRAGAAKAVHESDNTPGFLMGVVATNQDSCSTRTFSSFVSFMAMLTTLFWFVIAFIIVTSRGQVSVQNNLKMIAGCRSDKGTLGYMHDTYCGFGVDSCASDHICDDQSKFSSIDFNRSKTFEVVHGENVTSSGVGSVTLNVNTTTGTIKELVLVDVHYMPQQRMSLISVSKAINAQGFESPDFKHLTWKADHNCTLKLLETSETYQLDASVKYWKWTSSGIKVERSGAQH
jgi:hypothetical protein